MNSYRIAAIVPTYNRPERVRGAIQSILNQTRVPDDILVVDDASDANYDSVVDEFRGEITYIRLRNNVGGSTARNIGVEHTEADILMFLDDDDRWRPEKVERQVELFDQNTHVVYSNHVEVSDSGEILAEVGANQSGDLSKEIYFHNIGTTSIMAVTQSLFNHVGGFDEDLPGLQDWDLWIRLCQHSNVAADEMPTVERRTHDDRSNQMTGNWKNYVEAVDRLQNKYADDIQEMDWKDQRRIRARQYYSICVKAANAKSISKYKYAIKSISAWPTIHAIARLFPEPVFKRARQSRWAAIKKISE